MMVWIFNNLYLINCIFIYVVISQTGCKFPLAISLGFPTASAGVSLFFASAMTFHFTYFLLSIVLFTIGEAILTLHFKEPKAKKS